MRAVKEAEATLAAARAKYGKRMAQIDDERARLEDCAREEDKRWQEDRQLLEDALRRARG